MAFRTNLVPAIEERTVSGSSVSFNSAFALPLKACKVSFSATQSGSGEPSPSNPRAISGVSAIGLNANSTPVSVSLGDTRYGGELDVLTGILTVTHGYIADLGSYINYKANDVGGYFTKAVDTPPSVYGQTVNLLCSKLKTIPTTANIDAEDLSICVGNNTSRIMTKNVALSGYTLQQAKEFYSGTELVYPLAEPITIQLSANELSSIIGNNTFSTDTGTLEITFSDLQEKSASGSVATFNTALAMPLSSCNIAVNAWQEGSGDPNPIDNIRAIHGFSEVNLYQRVVNLWDEQWVQGALNTSGGINTFETTRRTTSFISVVPNTTYRQVSPQNAYGGRIAYYDINRTLLLYSGNGVSGGTKTFTTLANCRYVRITIGSGYGTTYNNDISINYPSTDTNYHAYTGNTYTIQLGQEVYGGVYNSVTGVLSVNMYSFVMDGDTNKYASPANWYSVDVADSNPTFGAYWYFNGRGFDNFPKPKNVSSADRKMLCETFQKINGVYKQTAPYSMAIAGSINAQYFGVRIPAADLSDTSSSSALTNSIMEWFQNNPTTFYYEIETPITVQLTPTQIETIAGKTNTIFADTGDIDLTYKDLDIAKRGNFREVFKLPS